MPLERLVTPYEVATSTIVLFRASDAAAAVTGHLVVAHGGWLAQ